MKRIWIILLTASLLVLAGCGGKEPVAFSGSKGSQPPGMETPVESAKPVENTELQQESTENKANVIEPSEASTTEYVPAVSVTRAMIMGLLVMKLQEYRISNSKPDNRNLSHITVLEEAHSMMNAQQVSEYLGVSVSYAYKIIDRLNRELEKAGFLTIHGKVDSLYLSRRFFPSVEQIQTTSN